jgi:hypothetical protein
VLVLPVVTIDTNAADIFIGFDLLPQQLPSALDNLMPANPHLVFLLALLCPWSNVRIIKRW